ncbi:MAG TPA: phospho-N-acetylmuramoyl-pentapeptide-transferase [Clostridiaceae bacterium]|nr:phospho-N-acetylmuramoyl-pentapeptide-transferase [Clostridiaceae bacterium]
MDLPFNVSIQVVVFVLTFLLALLVGPFAIGALRKLKAGQTVRNDGPSTHLKKQNTPTIGGIIFIIPFILMTLFYSGTYPKMIPMLLAVLGYGAIGFLDDYIKVVKRRKDGLYASQKTIGLLLVSAIYVIYVTFFTEMGTSTYIPFAGIEYELHPVVYMLFLMIVLYATTNSVNLTDGVDGLCAGVTLIVMVFFTLVAMTRSEWEHVKVFSSMIAGGCLGFLAFNIHPAKVFMGDTGSLALGGAVASAAIMMKMPLMIVIVGGIYVLESLSDILQVASFKLRGKRIFKMAPIHHHFELLGWKETKVVTVFWLVTVILCLVGMFALRFRFY